MGVDFGVILRCLGYLGFSSPVSFVPQNGQPEEFGHLVHTKRIHRIRATSESGVSSLFSMNAVTVGVWSMLSPSFFIFRAFHSLGCVFRTFLGPFMRWRGRGSRGRALPASRHMTHGTQLSSAFVFGRQRRRIDGQHHARAFLRLERCFRAETRLQDFGAMLGFSAPKSFGHLHQSHSFSSGRNDQR